MKISKHTSNELEANIYLCLGTFKEIQTFCKTLIKEELSEEEYWEVRWLCITEKRNIICSVITDNAPKIQYQDVLNHEIVHWVHYLLDYIWHPLDYDSWTEMLAYYISYYIKKWNEFLLWLRKKKKSKKK
jgi:hypothetical protein